MKCLAAHIPGAFLSAATIFCKNLVWIRATNVLIFIQIGRQISEV